MGKRKTKVDFANSPAMRMLTMEASAKFKPINSEINLSDVENIHTNPTHKINVENERIKDTSKINVENMGVEDTHKSNAETTHVIRTQFSRREVRNERINVLITPSLKNDVVRFAKINKISVNDLINQLLEMIVRK